MKLNCIILIVTLLILSTFYFFRTTPEIHLPPLIENVLLEKELNEISDNLSGLTWDETTETLIGIINSPARVVQLNTRGDVLQQFSLPTLMDTESIAFFSGNRFLIAEERKRRISLSSILLNHSRALPPERSFVFDLGGKRNFGLEGVAFSTTNDTLFIANEKFPAAVYKVSNFMQEPHDAIAIQTIFTSSKDISGLAWSESLQRLYILSDEAKKIIETDINGKRTRESYIDDYIKDIPQPEGIAVHDDTLYIVSEPNRFYALKMADQESKK